MTELLHMSIGWSTQSDAAHAGRLAAEQALEQLAPHRPVLSFVFGSSWFSQASLLHSVWTTLGGIPIIGGSTAGEIGPEGVLSHSCVVILLAAQGLSWSLGIGEEIPAHPRAAGQHAARMALQEFRGTTRAAFLMFGDGLTENFTEVTRGLQEILGINALIVGGLSGDDLKRSQTYQYYNERVLDHAVVGLLLGGDIKVGVGLEHGFAPISKPRQITRAVGSLLYELDGQPAAATYEEYFGTDLISWIRTEGHDRPGMAYPLGVKSDSSDRWILRTILSYKPDGSLLCSGEVQAGSWVQVMIANRELLLDAAKQATQHAIQSLDHVAGLLLFDSVSRRLLLGHQYAATELASIRHLVGSATVIGGCYTYGEQGPIGSHAVSGRTGLNTGSLLVVALGR